MAEMAGSMTCDVACNGSCYGPGIQSCIFDDPLYISDEWYPFDGDGTVWNTVNTAYNNLGRHMSYTEYSVSAWFYLKSAPPNP